MELEGCGLDILEIDKELIYRMLEVKLVFGLDVN